MAAEKRPASVLPGMVAGVVETLVVQPLDMVKTRFQIYEGTNPSLLRSFRDVFNEGGVLRFYRGLLPELASTAPARMAMYSSYTWTRHHLQDLASARGAVRRPGLEAFAAGFVSGVPESLVVTPLQLVKVRLQAKEHLGRYKNAFHCVRTVLSQEGVTALFTGLGPTIGRNCVYNSVYFCAQFELRELGVEGDGGSHAARLLRISGCAFLAGALATCFNAPFDVAKSRIQQQVAAAPSAGGSESPMPLKYQSTPQTLLKIWQEEGARALYKGFVPKVWRMALGGAVGMAAFEGTQILC